MQPLVKCRATCCVLLLLLLCGCGGARSADYSDLGLVEVSGRVTLDDIPLANARVEFESPDQTCSYAVTDANGEYRMMFNSEQPGCLPGEKTVRIRMSSPENAEDPDAEDASPIWIPPRYNSDSTLRADVSADNRTFDFDLSSEEEGESEVEP
jgi:hypothetical protein